MTETKKLLADVAAVDNRKLSEETATAWYHILGHLSLEVAQEALKLARRDTSIAYLEPKHIISWAKEASYKLDRNKPKNDEIINGDPHPRCKDHNKLVLACDPCCHRLYKFTVSHGFEDVHAFAKREIYA